jgi:hypothetical protein
LELCRWIKALEITNKIDLSSLQDGNLHLIAFLGNRFCYLIKDPKGSQWVIQDALKSQFPALVRQMLVDNGDLTEGS